MHVRDGMSRVVLVVGPGHTLRDAARLMAERRVGAAVVMDPDQPGPGIITERDIVDVARARAGPRRRAASATHMSDGHRLRRARLVAGGGGRHDGARAASATWSSSTAASSRASCRCATSCAAGPRTARSASCRRGHRRRQRGCLGARTGPASLRRRGADASALVRASERQLADVAARVADPAERSRRRAAAGRRWPATASPSSRRAAAA